MNRSPPFVAILGGLLFAVPALGHAESSGAIQGVVTALDGSPLAGVTVTVSNVSIGMQKQATLTDSGGRFHVAFLPAAKDYELRASFPDLATVVLGDIKVVAGRTATLEITMQPQTDLQERVEVRAQANLIDLANTTTETRFSSEFIDSLPIYGRNYQDVLKLAPGVSDVDGDGNPNIHGARDTDVVTLVDGVSSTDPLTGKIGAQLNIESIQEIEVKTSGATAEFSRAQGGFVNIITKSGGNKFEGSFKFFWRGSTLDGDGAGSPDPALHAGVGEHELRELEFNDFLPFLSLSGPIVKDHAWYFVALEYIQIEKPINVVNAAFVTGVEEERAFGKLTWQASQNNRIVASLNHDPQEFLNEGLNSFTREETGFSWSQGGTMVTLRGQSILSPTVALETTLAHFDGRPVRVPNLHPDTNGNGELYIDRNQNGFLEAWERDPGEDYDGDGVFDIFEDTIIRDRRLQPREDADGDRRVTPPYACEGKLREDIDCDGRLDVVNEDVNRNGLLDPGEDVDNDFYLDLGNEDRNGNGILDDAVRPGGNYPYGRTSPEPADRDYTIDLLTGVVSGPYFDQFSDSRERQTLRQDLDVFVSDFHGSHDFRMGYVLEREDFDRQTTAYDISARRDFGPPVCTSFGGVETCTEPLPPVPGQDPAGKEVIQRTPSAYSMLLPVERRIENDATGRTLGLYVQDVYKPRPNLSIGLGVRFDREIADSNGYAQFDPRAEAYAYNRLNALSGAEQGRNDTLQGDANGINSHGILSDPFFQQGPDTTEVEAGFLVDPLRMVATGRLSRHRSAISFASPRVETLLSQAFVGGELDLDLLAMAGVRPQQPERFSLTNNNLAPRLALSWDPWSDGKTKLFATWGRYYDKLFLSSIVGEQGPDRVGRYYKIDHSGLDVVERQTAAGPKGLISISPNHRIGDIISKTAPSTTQVDRSLQTPYSDEFTAGFEREIGPDIALSVRYIDRKYRDQLQDVDLNHANRFDSAAGEPIDVIGQMIVLGDTSNIGQSNQRIRLPDGRPDLYINNFFFNQVLRIGNLNEARYRGIELELRKRLSRRWQLQGSYTYSRALGDAEDFQSRLGNDPTTQEAEYGYLDFDQRHVVKLNAVSFLPRDWQVGVSASWSSGLPYSVVSRFFGLDNDYQQFRTLYGYRTIENGDLIFKETGRNSGRNDSFYDINLHLRKSVVIGRISTALFLEVFNILNSDDLWIHTFEPNRGDGFNPTQRNTGSDVSVGTLPLISGPLQLDAERRFGRRWQIGLQFDF
jgi:outer membrane receptor protein involved in Fe transport